MACLASYTLISGTEYFSELRSRLTFDSDKRSNDFDFDEEVIKDQDILPMIARMVPNIDSVSMFRENSEMIDYLRGDSFNWSSDEPRELSEMMTTHTVLVYPPASGEFEHQGGEMMFETRETGGIYFSPAAHRTKALVIVLPHGMNYKMLPITSGKRSVIRFWLSVKEDDDDGEDDGSDDDEENVEV